MSQIIAIVAFLYVTVAIGFAAEVSDKRRARWRSVTLGIIWPVWGCLLLGVYLARKFDR